MDALHVVASAFSALVADAWLPGQGSAEGAIVFPGCGLTDIPVVGVGSWITSAVLVLSFIGRLVAPLLGMRLVFMISV